MERWNSGRFSEIFISFEMNSFTNVDKWMMSMSLSSYYPGESTEFIQSQNLKIERTLEVM